MIDPGGDFDGDGDADGADATRYWLQYVKWNYLVFSPPTGTRLTYYHGDMDGDGVVDGTDLNLALGEEGVIINQQATPYELGEEGTLEMNWNPNAPDYIWLPCWTSSSSSMGP